MLRENNSVGRRGLLGAAAGVSAVVVAGAAVSAGAQTQKSVHGVIDSGTSRICTRDGVSLYYKDWGPKDGRVVTLSHGWPLSSDSWENQAFFLANHGFRVIAHDRRGHGRSSQPWDGNDMDHYADDLAAVFDALDLHNVSIFGFSTGGGEVARYVGRHGTGRVAKLGLISAVPPIVVQTADNPGGLPRAVFDGTRSAFVENRSKLFRDIPSGPFYGFNRPGAKVDPAMVDFWWSQGMQGGFKNTYDSIKAFSETDFRGDLAKFDKPTLIIHGDDDQIVPIEAAGRASKKFVPHAILKVYEGAPHGLTETHKDRLNKDLLEFLKA